ncbi:MAG: hybrid sensor histidine kinase/response regulator [Planctomycetaceae bacterium]|nr:hybrid sensor histidine kinase/response regulator [Planctomycetaceae bacterium]
METNPPTPDCECPDAPPQLGVGLTGNVHNKVSVLLIDDDEDDYFLTSELIADIHGERFTLDWASTYEAGVAAICGHTHDLYLLDYRLGAKTGIDLLREVHEHGCSGPVILLTGQGQGRTDLEALNAGADDYLEKAGLTSAMLERAMRYALVQHRAATELERKVNARTEELARVNEALRDASRRKDEFLSTLGHELRNPLAPILNGLEIMRLAADNPAIIARQRDRLERQVNQLTRLVEDLLDVSRITTGKLRLNHEPITLSEVIETAIEISRPNIEKANVELEVTLPPESVHLSADRVRLTQVFSNLLNNAAKYTESGGRITLLGYVESGHVTVRVRDTGVGIPPELIPQIFELFTQVNQTLNRSQGGLGVGLALVRRLVELHKGTVSARSEGPGTGAEFTVVLPISEVADPH